MRLFDAVVFNFLIGNSDAHGKNFSFLYERSNARLAPLYDLVCTQAYPHLSEEMAMKIGDQRTASRIMPKNWRMFFKEAGFGPAAAERRLRDLATRVVQGAKAMAEENTAGAQRVAQVVLANFQRLHLEKWPSE